MKQIALFLLALVITATGCEGESDHGGEASLNGTRWKLVAWSASSINPAPFDITANFDEKTIGGRSAVNTYGGDYQATADGSIRIGPVVSTLMAGPPEAMDAERLYFELLERVRRFRLENNQLELLDQGGQELLIFDAM